MEKNSSMEEVLAELLKQENSRNHPSYYSENNTTNNHEHIKKNPEQLKEVEETSSDETEPGIEDELIAGDFFDELGSEEESSLTPTEDLLVIPPAEEVINRIFKEQLTSREQEMYRALKDNVAYKSGDAAEFLHLSKPTLIYYADAFDKLLNIQRKESNHRILYKQDIVRIGRIIQFKNRYRLSREQAKEYLMSEGAEIFTKPPEQVMKEFMDVFMNRLDEHIKEATTLLLETSAKENKVLELAQTEFLKKIEEKDRQIEQLMVENDKLTVEITKVVEEMKITKEEIIQQIEKKKKWSFFKK